MLLADVVHTPLTPQEKIILRELIDCGHADFRRLSDQLWGRRRDGGPETCEDIIRVEICRIRKKLRPEWRIVAQYARGYWLIREDHVWWNKDTRRTGGESAAYVSPQTAEPVHAGSAFS